MSWATKLANALTLLFALSFAVRAGADPLAQSVSAYRFPDERFEEALARNTGQDSRIWNVPRYTALGVADTPERLNIGLIPAWSEPEDLQRAFVHIRDDHFLTLPEDPAHPRQIPWNYSLDGCFARAALASAHIESLGLRRPAKIFIFGDLEFHPPAGGVVTWWFHVAPVVSQGGKVYVLDPAVEPSHPLPLDEWIGRIAPDRYNVALQVCNTFAYLPQSLCYISGPWAEGDALSDGLSFARRLGDLR